MIAALAASAAGISIGEAGIIGDPAPQLVAFLGAGAQNSGYELGRSVTFREPFLIAGAWGASSQDMPLHGGATIWRWSPGGWQLEGNLVADDRAAGDRFGVSSAVARSMLLMTPNSAAVVGAHLADVAGQADAGAAYVFRRSAEGSWSQEAKLVPADVQAGAQFGRAVAFDCDTIAIGAPQRNNFRGAVYIFQLTIDESGSHWVQQAVLTPTDVWAGDQFGSSLALAAGTLVVGSPGADLGLSLNQGAAYVFERTNGAWAQTAKLLDPDGVQLDEFGRSVAINAAKSTVVVANSPSLTTKLGEAHVFVRSEGSWAHDAVLLPESPEPGDQFGSTVAIEEELVAVGAPSRTVAGQAFRGAVYLYQPGDEGWEPTQPLIDPQGKTGDSLGCAVSLSGEGLVIGARGLDGGNTPNLGAVLIAWSVDCNADMEFNLCHPDVADLSGDGFVDGDDLGSLLGFWGASDPWGPGDLNGDGRVDGDDLGCLLGQWTG